MDVKKNILTRFTFVFILLILLSTVILGIIVKLKIFDGGANYKSQFNTTNDDSFTEDANRGDILAVDGRKLACSVPNYRIRMDMNADGLTDQVFNRNVGALAQKLSSFFNDAPASVYVARLKKERMGNNRYYLVNNRRITYNELQIVKQFPLFNLGLNKGGFIAEQNSERKFPFGLLASRTIGKLYLDKERGGMLGLEKAYDEELTGKPGVYKKMRLSNRWVRYEISAPEDGLSLMTTIDIDIQDVAEHSLMKQLRKHNAHHGVVILMEVKTGAVRAIVNLHRASDGSYIEDHYNYAIGESMEPGSTFKLASIIAALEDGVTTIDDTINTFKGAYRFYDRIMRDSKEGGYGNITVREGFEKSSNIAVSRLIVKGYSKNPQRFIDRMKEMHLGDSLGIEIMGEGMPVIKNPKDKLWSGITLPWMSIGYEVALTPLHTLTFYNAIANNGKMMRPMFVEGLMERGSVVKRFSPKVLNSSVCSRGTVSQVQDLLKGVVERGTAQNIKGTPYGIAGKTGTAQIAQGGTGYKNKGTVNYLASFAGYFPADNPLYSCIVVVNGPSNNVYYGNVLAGSVFKDIADRVYAAGYNNSDFDIQHKISESNRLPIVKNGSRKELERVLDDLGIDVKKNRIKTQWVTAKAGEEDVVFSAKNLPEGIMPDVRGMGARDATALLNNAGLYVQLSGVGRVVQQSVSHGDNYQKGATVFLKLD